MLLDPGFQSPQSCPQLPLRSATSTAPSSQRLRNPSTAHCRLSQRSRLLLSPPHSQFHHPCPPAGPGASHPESQTHVLHHGFSGRFHVQDHVSSLSPRNSSLNNDDDLWDIGPSLSLNFFRIDSEQPERPSLGSSRLHTCIEQHRRSAPLLKPTSYLHHYLLSTEASAQPTQRSLTSFVTIHNDEMTAVTAPSSPPDLSGSKSSKSSSYHSSSQLSSPDGILTDISNFEDIGLDDDAAEIYTNAHGFAKQQARSTSNGTMQQKPAAEILSRELVAPSRPDFPSLHGQVQSALANNSPEILNSSRRSHSSKLPFSSTSTSSLTIPPKRPPGRSSSSSPSRQTPASATSSYTIGSASLRPGSPNLSRLSSRRDSWQPTRKSVKELEAEYHDSDDELPDDTALWNVPMSPRPPPDRSWPSSRNGSPDRNLPATSPRPTPLEHTVSEPVTSEETSLDTVPQVLPKQRIPPRTTSLNHDFHHNNPSTKEFRSTFRDHRAKSWTLAMSDMSEEARQLTEALEFHANESERRHEDRLQKGIKSSRPSLETSMQSCKSKSFVELPPLQKSNIMIDPLPPSKEKELVLSRTRPSWLPPKDPREERKHLKEYQRMMTASIEAEKRREQKKIRATCDKDNTRETLNQIWEQYVFPDWQKTVSEHRTRELWWRGVSPKVRGLVWERAVGNELALTPETYRKAHDRAQEAKSRLSKLPASDETGPEDRRIKGWFEDIKNDVQCIWPELNLFQPGGPYHNKLLDVLEAYAMYRRDVGYCYGIHTVAALMLLQLPDPPAAFSLLANILNRRLALAYLTNDPTGTGRASSLALQTLAYKLPRLHDYLFGSKADEGQGKRACPRSSSRTPSPNKSTENEVTDRTLNLTPTEVFEPLFRTLFTNILPVDHVTRVWDCFVFEGDRILIRTSVAVLGMLEAHIFDVPGNDVWEKKELIRQLIGWGPFGRASGKMESVFGDVDRFMEAVREAGRADQ